MRKETIRHKGVTFTDLPVKLKDKDYTAVLASIHKELIKYPEITAYLAGNYAFPGFSSIDLIIICKKPSKDLKKFFNVEKMDDKKKYVVFHEPLFLSADLARRYHMYAGSEHANWTLFKGNSINMEKTNETNIDFKIIDDVISNIAFGMLYPKYSKKIKVRETINFFYDFRYGVAEWMKKEMDSKQLLKIEKFNSSVSKLREYWFSRDIKDDFDKLIKLFDEAYIAFEAYLNFLKEYVQKKYVKDNANRQFCIYDVHTPLIFSNQKNYTEETKIAYMETGKKICFLPQELFCLISEYRKQEGTLGSYLHKNSTPSKSILKDEFKKIAGDRLKYYDDRLDYCIENGLGYGPIMNFGLHEIPKRIHSRIRRSIESSLEREHLKKILQKLMD